VAISQDASTPSFSATVGGTNIGANITGTSGSITSASFSPPANSLVVVIAIASYGSPGTFATCGMTCSDSHSNNYADAFDAPSNSTSYGGISYFEFYYGSAPGSTTVTVLLAAGETVSANSTVNLVVLVFDGCASSQTSPATASNRVSTISQQVVITPTVIGSQLLCVAVNGTSNPYTVISGTTSIDQKNGDPEGNSLVWGKQTALTSALTSQTLGYTNSASPALITALEILPAGGGGGTSKSDTESAALAEGPVLVGVNDALGVL
jgi:hypothetical protein